MAGSRRVSAVARFGLALAVPGLGHFASGRWGKGALFLGAILGSFAFGWGVTGGEAVSFRRHPLVLTAQGGAAGPTALALYLSRSRPQQKWIDALLEMRAISPEEADRIPRGVSRSDAWNHLRRKTGVADKFLEAAYWESSRRAEPRMDVGVLYAMIAGLLNLLVAADAAQGAGKPDGK